MTPELIYKRFGKPDLEPVVRLNNQPIPEGVPEHGVLPVRLGVKSELIPLSDANIFLSDFGKSFLPSIVSRNPSSTPAHHALPEAHFLRILYLSQRISGPSPVPSGQL
jgi:serine/threonine-protein kinase SRPK3